MDIEKISIASSYLTYCRNWSFTLCIDIEYKLSLLLTKYLRTNIIVVSDPEAWYKRFHSIHLKCIAGLMYNAKGIGVGRNVTWGAESWPLHLRCSEWALNPLPIYLRHPLGAQFSSNLGPEWTRSHHSKEGLQVSERGIEKGARGINKGKKRARGLRHAYHNLYMCI